MFHEDIDDDDGAVEYDGADYDDGGSDIMILILGWW